jgi:two-component system response regulator FlrC
MPGQRIFLIAEHPKERMGLVNLFEQMGFLVDAVPDGTTAEAYLIQNKPDLVVADDCAPDFSSLEFLKHCAKLERLCKTIILTSDPVVDHAVSLMKHGAADYLIKPVDNRQLELSIRKAVVSDACDRKAGTSESSQPKTSVRIITKDPSMEKLLGLAARVADSTASVLIQGESGTGKELFGRYLHEKSRRHAQPFIAVNCAALPENLLESELFGHEKGAFTGALSRKMGKFELADKGTLFLDEITEMQFHLQAKLLRVLQEKVVDRVGGTQAVGVDVRVIATTNQDPKEAVANKAFREDLYYRLNTIPLLIPPLTARSRDVDLLTDYFIKKYAKIDARDVKGMTQEAAALLRRHPFPGNVRELENIVHRAVLLAQSDQIQPHDLLMDGQDLPSSAKAPSAPPSVESSVSGSLKEMEQQMIYKTLDQTEGNRTHAAKILGISVRTLRNKLNEYKEQI